MKNVHYSGPSLPISQEIGKMKYYQDGEDFDGKIKRIARALSDDETHRLDLEEILGEMRFLPAGRVQSAMGAKKLVTAYNCFVSGQIHDSMNSIMDKAKEAAETMRKGGGIGYSFSKIRPKGAHIKSLDSKSSGPVSFMNIYDAVCQTIASAGNRRGAQMAVLRVDHPDIYDFVRAKQNQTKLTGFNVSVGITDAFMEALTKEDDSFNLVFDGKVYETISARHLWNEIMEMTWDWAEPGVLFIDRINEMNNLWYCEEIEATNPCGEQPLPPYGACLLGSFNMTRYLTLKDGVYSFNYTQFKKDIAQVVRAMDNVIDRTIYPLPEQEDEAKKKRRMGLGLTGVANAGEILGFPYASAEFFEWFETVLKMLRNESYKASAELAKEKGPFPLYNEKWLKSGFAKTLPFNVRKMIQETGIRNSHLTSIAPTGTISLEADNISGGIEPVFSHYYTRTIQTEDGPITESIEDYAYTRGVAGVKAGEVNINNHVAVLAMATHYVDSAVSKTCNVGDDVTFEEFKNVYYSAWKQNCKGITTFRAAGKRYGILNEIVQPKDGTEGLNGPDGAEGPGTGATGTTGTTGFAKSESKSAINDGSDNSDWGGACFIDPLTGQKECS